MLVLPGSPHPLGSKPEASGVNFSIYSKHARAATLLLFDSADAPQPSARIELHPRQNRTWHYWHVLLAGVKAGQCYGWQLDGPNGAEDLAHGLRFDPSKLLLDPYARAIAQPAAYSREAAREPGRSNLAQALRSVVVADHSGYDWEGDRPLHRPFAQTIIYELHVRGFTMHESSGVADERRGRFRGLIDKIPYLQELGITAVELMPVFAFDAQDAPSGRSNYWGYSPLSFFAPHAGYAMPGCSPLQVLDEFRDMVKALHRAGIEVILDVVYNHSAEGGENGPTQSLRGLDNRTYYLLDERGRYADHSGCGNTLNANHSVVRRMILDSLRYWVQVMHVDGFRFDLAAILSRDESGQPNARAPVIWDIDSDPALAGTKLIAEAWDAGGLYQVGGFAGDHWKEWNGQFRDDVRDFVRGRPGTVGALAERLLGSPRLYDGGRREPTQSINFVTSHDGFTLRDLVSFDRKHNEANGEDNRDGHDDNRSWNCGVEGETDDPQLRQLRIRQIKNLLAINLLSLGTPMLLMGDELGRTQGGNNNAYCQDNPTSWLDWRGLHSHAELMRWVRGLIQIRNLRESVRDDPHLSLGELMQRIHVELHGVHLGRPDWSEDSRSLALTATSLSGHLRMHFALNAWWEPLEFELPELDPTRWSGWLRVLDSGRPCPQDLVSLAQAEGVVGARHRVEPRSVTVLFARATPGLS
jgi:isoamylase